MLGGKRGLSTVVTTLIIVLISVLAVGIVWVVVRNLINSESFGVDVGVKCLNVYVEATAINCSSTGSSRICDVTLKRTGTGTNQIGGVKLVFRNATSGTNSPLINVAGNIEQLVGKKQTGINTTLPGVNQVDVTAFFSDAGNEHLCSQTNPFKTSYSF